MGLTVYIHRGCAPIKQAKRRNFGGWSGGGVMLVGGRVCERVLGMRQGLIELHANEVENL